MEFKWQILLLLLKVYLSYSATCKWSTDNWKFFQDSSCDQNSYCKTFQENSYFNVEVKKCIIPLGSPCYGNAENGMFQCASNSICNYQDHCVCDTLYLQRNGSCVKAKGHEEDCSESSECGRDVGLSCQQGKCLCRGKTVWTNETSICIQEKCEDRSPDAFKDPKSHECKLKLKGNSSGTVMRFLERSMISCPKDSSMRGNHRSLQCTCDLNFTESEDLRKCLLMKTYGQTCSANEELRCNDFIGLSCQEGVCKCGHPSATYNTIDSLCYSEHDCQNRYYGTYFYTNATAMECRCLLDRPCWPINKMAKDLSTCPDEAFHPNYNQYGPGCNCNDGYVTSTDGKTCNQIKFYGEDCSADEESFCSRTAKLTCLKNSTCGCKENQVWSTLSQKCGLKESQRCSNYGEESCARHASCEYYNRHWNQCKCDKGYSLVNGHCLGDYLSNCEFNGDCQDVTHCMDGLCKCKNLRQQFYDSKKKECITLAGSPCNSGYACITNSDCVNATCKCDDGFHKTPKGNCVNMLKHGESCTSGQCDFTQGLACANGVCACVDEFMTVVPGKGCIAAVGQECGLLELVGKCSIETDKQCESYMVNCDSTAHCQHVGKGLSHCQLRSA